MTAPLPPVGARVRIASRRRTDISRILGGDEATVLDVEDDGEHLTVLMGSTPLRVMTSDVEWLFQGKLESGL